MGAGRRVRNLLKQGREIAQRRFIQMQGKLTAGGAQFAQNDNQIPDGQTMGPENGLQLLLPLTKERGREAYCRPRKYRGGGDTTLPQ